MKKIQIVEKVDDITLRSLEMSLEDLQIMIGNLIAEHGKDAFFDWDPHFYYSHDSEPFPRFYLKKSREETTAEYDARIQALIQQKKLQDERDLEQYNKLKEKFDRKQS